MRPRQFVKVRDLVEIDALVFTRPTLEQDTVRRNEEKLIACGSSRSHDTFFRSKLFTKEGHPAVVINHSGEFLPARSHAKDYVTRE
jgi:hypothetical protein